MQDDILNQEIDESAKCDDIEYKFRIIQDKDAVYNGEFSDAGTIDLFTNPNEGPIPHFHFKPRQGGNEGCICFLIDRYFSHKKHSGTLDKKAISALKNFLQQPGPMGKVWDMLIYEWDKDNHDNNESIQVPDGYPMPDYKASMSTINDGKGSKELMLALLEKFYKETEDLLHQPID